LNALLRHPGIGRALILWSVTGGPFAAHFLGHIYHEIYIEAAEEGGMQAVAERPSFGARIEENPENRERLLAMDPAVFIATMRRWNQAFHARPNDPVAGVSGDFGSITVPTLVFDGNDDIHAPDGRRNIGAGRSQCAVGRFTLEPGKNGWDVSNQTVPGSVFDLYPRLAPQMLEFIRSLDATN
jgi:pimeloyl-ACP methyl ester carboxylesterase